MVEIVCPSCQEKIVSAFKPSLCRSCGAGIKYKLFLEGASQVAPSSGFYRSEIPTHPSNGFRFLSVRRTRRSLGRRPRRHAAPL